MHCVCVCVLCTLCEQKVVWIDSSKTRREEKRKKERKNKINKKIHTTIMTNNKSEKKLQCWHGKPRSSIVRWRLCGCWSCSFIPRESAKYNFGRLRKCLLFCLLCAHMHTRTHTPTNRRTSMHREREKKRTSLCKANETSSEQNKCTLVALITTVRAC